MFTAHAHRIENRIFCIHQPHVRPVLRGKINIKVGFGAKIIVSFMDGISFLNELSWKAYNEGRYLLDYVENYKKRFGFFPKEVLADQIYFNRLNRTALKQKGIKLLAKPLGRPSAVFVHVSPGERNPIEGKIDRRKPNTG